MTKDMLLPMELNHLRYFYEVAKAGSFTGAARVLKISQSALSKTVASLEAREDTLLLHRSKTGVKLTESGLRVYSKCESIFATVNEIQNEFKQGKEKFAGPLKFGASDHLVNYLLVKQLQKMHVQHTKILPSIFSGTPNEIIELIQKSQLEFGLFFTKVNVSGISYEAITSFPMAIVCHPRLAPTKNSERCTIPELKLLIEKHGLIGSIKKDYQKNPSSGLFELLGNEPKVSFESSSQETQKRLCIEGAGFAFLTRFMVEEELNKGSLVEIRVKNKLQATLLLAKLKNRPLSFNAKYFLDSIKAHPSEGEWASIL